MSQTQTVEQIRQFEAVDLYRQEHPDAESWAVGYGQIEHSPQTQQKSVRNGRSVTRERMR